LNKIDDELSKRRTYNFENDASGATAMLIDSSPNQNKFHKKGI